MVQIKCCSFKLPAVDARICTGGQSLIQVYSVDGILQLMYCMTLMCFMWRYYYPVTDSFQ